MRPGLRAMPGIGPVIALAIRAEAGDLRRFVHHRQFLKFCGLELCTVQSGQSRPRTRISKCGNKRLHTAGRRLKPPSATSLGAKCVGIPIMPIFAPRHTPRWPPKWPAWPTRWSRTGAIIASTRRRRCRAEELAHHQAIEALRDLVDNARFLRPSQDLSSELVHHYQDLQLLAVREEVRSGKTKTALHSPRNLPTIALA